VPQTAKQKVQSRTPPHRGKPPLARGGWGEPPRAAHPHPHPSSIAYRRGTSCILFAQVETPGQTPGSVVQFGKYLLDAEIARGGMARVFRARLRGLGGFEKTLVVKQILPELARDPRFVEMFVAEANTLVAMSHPGIVPVYELGIVDGVYFLAMEHVDGATLADILRDGPLPAGLAAHVGVSICDALHYAHERFGVVHRDVTPRNVIVDAAGHVRLLDFGIAAPAEGTATTEIFGSHGYMSPEQLHGETLTPASDVFALGAVLYEALSGTPAFFRGDVAASRTALLEAPPPTLDRDVVPRDVAVAVEAALHRDIAARPASADVFGRRLRGWLAGAHPEGVARELGVRVEMARARRDRGSERPPAMDATPGGRRDPSGLQRTLAQSRALDAMLTGRIDAPTTGPRTAATSANAPAGTVPVERKRAAIEARPQPNNAPGKQLRIALVLLALPLAALLTWRVVSDSGSATDANADAGAESVVDADAAAVAAAVADADAAAVAAAVADADAAADADAVAAADADAASATASDAAPAAAPPDAAARAAPALLSVNAIPWANVRLDGRALGTTPRRNVPLPAGAHNLELDCPPLGRSVRVPIRAVAGETTRVVVDLSADPPQVTTQ